jgi:hypothetical protein
MSTAELNEIKLNLISWINQISDADLISFLEGIRNSRSKGDWWDELSSDQKKIIQNGLKDAEDGKVISSSQFLKKLKNA